MRWAFGRGGIVSLDLGMVGRGKYRIASVPGEKRETRGESHKGKRPHHPRRGRSFSNPYGPVIAALEKKREKGMALEQ